MENLRELRLAKKLTQAELAKLVGVSLAGYLLWERGVGKPNEENKKKLMEALDIEPERENDK
ncbi:XRE family transcriptional regulator [bacterium]|nr:XRE family transcriptional regulator [bacterium]